MAELTDREARALAGSFRGPQKRVLIVGFINVAMAALILGLPYLRGRELARAERAHFTEFVRCMIGGSPAPAPGLSLPRGDREHYAAKVLFAGPEWPLSCRPLLQQLRPPEAVFLWPGIKVAAADLRAAIDLVDRELEQLSQRRIKSPGRVPERPLQALQRLQAASVLFARAGDATHDIDNDGIVLDSSVRGLPRPSRLPLMIGESLALDAWSDTGVFEALSLDAHNLAYVHVDNGKVDRQRLRRNAFLRGVVRAGTTPYLVWAMPEARCSEDPERCVGRPTGLARFENGSNVLGEPTWKLPGHPAGRIDRVLSITETGRVDLLATANKSGGLELMRVRLPDDAMSASAPGQAPEPKSLGATDTWPIVEQAAATSVTLVAGEPLAVLRASDSAAGSVEASVLWADEAPRTLSLPPAAGSGAWAVACGSDAAPGPAAPVRWLVYGSSAELHIAQLQAGPSVRELRSEAAQLEAPVHESDRARDRVRLECTSDSARLFYLDTARVLRMIDCPAADSCRDPRELARDVTQFSVLSRGPRTLLSYHGGPSAPTIKVLRLDEHGTPAAAPAVVASCWEPYGGMCGTSFWVGDAQRALLLARDGPDLLALETGNDAFSFTSLSGFTDTRALPRDVTSPLQQHRLKKGVQ